MAFPNQLVEAVATALGVPTKTVAQHDRILASSGYRKVGGRGRNASVTILDAANLIIAVVGGPVSGPSVRDTTINYEKYASLGAAHPFILRELASWPIDLVGLGDLVRGHSFRDAVASLIQVFADSGELPTAKFFGRAAREPFRVVGNTKIRISFDGPRPEAKIFIEGEVYDLTSAGPNADLLDFMKEPYSASINYRELPPEMDDQDLENWILSLARTYRGDLRQTRTITEGTLAEVAKLFSQRSETPNANEHLN